VVVVVVIVITYRYCCCCYYYRSDPIRLRYHYISIGWRFGTNCTQFGISFDSILFQFESIRFDCAPPVTILLLLSYQTIIMWVESNWDRKSPGAEVRFDPMRFRSDSISIGCGFGTNSTRFRISFDSILFQFDSIRLCISCDVVIIIII
jgi:hypothetical protein